MNDHHVNDRALFRQRAVHRLSTALIVRGDLSRGPPVPGEKGKAPPPLTCLAWAKLPKAAQPYVARAAL
eukprot:2092681-Alexandrium_andersonii.AAC.1